MDRLRKESVEWLASCGYDQWQPQAMAKRNKTRDAERGLNASLRREEVFICLLDELPVGTIIVDDYSDPEFWQVEERSEKALYLHRMIVARSAAGGDIGGRMLEWATNRASELDKQWLRLDAWRTNYRLRSYYEAHGFRLVRVVELPHRGSGALYQLAVPPVSETGVEAP